MPSPPMSPVRDLHLGQKISVALLLGPGETGARALPDSAVVRRKRSCEGSAPPSDASPVATRQGRSHSAALGRCRHLMGICSAGMA